MRHGHHLSALSTLQGHLLMVGLCLAVSSPVYADEPLDLEPDVVLDTSIFTQLMSEGEVLAEKGDHLQAILRFSDILRNAYEDLSVTKEAEFAMGVSLHELGLNQSALAFFEAVVEAAEAHPRYVDTLPYLLAIARDTDGDSNVLAKLASYPPKLYPAAFADEIHFLVGQHHYGEGLLDEALSRFQQVSFGRGDDAGIFVRARYMEGVIQVQRSNLATDPETADPERLSAAADAFKSILRHTRDHGGDDTVDKLSAMAHLALGRLFFSTRQYDVSVRYYDRIEEDSKDWLPSLFEVSWVHFQLKNYPRALGNLHTLNSPFFEDQYFPESRVLQALILFYGCRYDEAEAVVKAFVQDYYPLMTELKDEINQFADPNAFYRWLAKLSKQEVTEYSARFKRIFNAALADRKLRRKFYFVTSLNAELDRLRTLREGQDDAAELLETLMGEITAYRSLVIGEAGTLAQNRLMRLLKELKQHLAGALRIKGETLKARRGSLAASLRAEQAAAAAVRVDITVDEEHIEWPFTGEYWKDELGSYIFDVPSRCEQTSPP